ncbi:hypothetical protein LA080_012213 [Diaporthe eres]|uniref:Uncharacterized protein n=1 Tax=Diaporthe vaccinii TaxID=105482 RepID=A0ABR4F5M2_9PEZI|nr:hypothetical protein LA080_012213 [Diaporthe eres]
MYGRPYFDSLYHAGLGLFHFPVVLMLLELLVKCVAVFLWILLYLGFLLWLCIVAIALFVYAYAPGRGSAPGQMGFWSTLAAAKVRSMI